jgi:hypothetical protein
MTSEPFRPRPQPSRNQHFAGPTTQAQIKLMKTGIKLKKLVGLV